MTATQAKKNESVNREHPFWSVMIPTCNPRLDYLRQTVQSVLAEHVDEPGVHIELVDDASEGFDPAKFVASIGDPRLSWYSHTQPQGIGGNWNACLQRSRGRWVHILHQDDTVLPGFYQRLRSGIDAVPNLGAAFCQGYVIDAAGRRGRQISRVDQPHPGVLSDWIQHVFVDLSIASPCIVVRRDVYEALGWFDTSWQYVLDWDMWKRIAASYPLWYEPEPSACYREHNATATRRLQRSGANLEEIKRSIASSAALVPTQADDIVARASAHYTRYALSNAVRCLLQQHDLRAALAQLDGARRIQSIRTAAKTAAQMTRSWLSKQ